MINLRSTAGQISTEYVATGGVLAVAPVVLLFVFLQRFVIGPLTAGAVKG